MTASGQGRGTTSHPHAAGGADAAPDARAATPVAQEPASTAGGPGDGTPPRATATAVLTDEAATAELGRQLGELLFPGAVIALTGELGAGKTALCRAIAEGLGIADPAAVTSPTFVLIQEYAARLPIYHCDAYRLRHAAELWELGIDEYLFGDGVCLIEWADRVAAVLPPEHLHIALVIRGLQRREARLTAVGQAYVAVLERLAAVFPLSPRATEPLAQSGPLTQAPPEQNVPAATAPPQ